MKIAVLCSHPFAFLSISHINQRGILAGLGGPEKPNFTHQLQAISTQFFVPIKIFSECNEETIQEWLDLVMPDVVFVMGFPYKIPASILSTLPHGFLNFHIGLLPKYRGIDPAYWQIRNRESSGGITVHKMEEGYDNGPILLQRSLEIGKDDTYGVHLHKLSSIARDCTVETIQLMNENNLVLKEQDDLKCNYLNRPEIHELSIDFDRTSSQSIKALIQASNPGYGGAICYYKATPLRILQASLQGKNRSAYDQPGTIVSIGNNLHVLCSDKRLLSLDIIYCDAGLFTGERFASTFGVTKGDIITVQQFTSI